MARSVEGRRERRLRLSLTIAKRRRDEHLSISHRGDRSTVACICELADWYFDKRPSLGCGCRKRKHGRPRVAAGMCDIGQRERIYEWRQEARGLRLAVRAGRGAPGEPDRHWAKGKGRGTFTIESCSLHDEDAVPRERDWFLYRSYRTATGRDTALKNFTHKEAGSTSSRRNLYRVGPSRTKCGV